MFATITCLAHLTEHGACARRLPDDSGYALAFARHEQLVPAEVFERFISLGYVQADPDGLFRITPAGRAQVRYSSR